MKKLLFILVFFPLILFGQKIKGEKLFSIKAAIGEYQSSVGEYLNLNTIYAPYTKGIFDGITTGKVLPIGGDFPLYHQENGKTFADLDIDLVLLTEENEKIYCKATGVFNYVTETFESLKFQTHWRFRTSSEKYKYLNDVIAIGFGYVLPQNQTLAFQISYLYLRIYFYL